MDNYGDLGVSSTSKPSRKKRSNLNRRPLNESVSPQEYLDSVSMSSTPSDHASDAPSVGNVHEDINWRNGLNSSQCMSRASYTDIADAETVDKSFTEDVASGESDDLKGFIEGNPEAASSKIMKMKNSGMNDTVIGSRHSGLVGAPSDGAENICNKVKLKVGGVTHTIRTRSSFNSSSVSGTSATKSTPSDVTYPPQKPNHMLKQENFDSHFTGEKDGLRGVPWKDFSRTGFKFGKADSSRGDIPLGSAKQTLKHSRPSRSKSIVEKYSSDDVYEEEDDDDDEIRYLQKLRTSKIASYGIAEYEDENRGKKLRKISKVMERNTDGFGDDESSRSGKENKKSRSLRALEDTDYMEDEESVSDGEIENKNKKQRKESVEVSEYPKTETSITTRRRAILTGTDISPGLGASPIQFPGGLPPAPPRKQKEQLTEVEQQLKRAEAAQRRKIQSEKAARESEAEAIRKILGQDSSRKRREEKIKKRQEELAQERNANAGTVASNVVRWVMGPSGTVVTFPNEIGLPSIFESKPCSYPPPREKCAAPSCTNVYKYRDSKSKLPLCSLQCYKALHEKTRYLPAC